MKSSLTLLLILFIILKLSNTVQWSWWLVLAPFWVPLLIGIILAGMVLLMAKK